jgi:hypothetical protein
VDIPAPPYFLKGVPSLLKTMAVTHAVTLVVPVMLLAQYAVLLVPAHLHGFLGDAGVHQPHLVLPISSFCFYNGGLVSSLAVFSRFFRTSRRALVQAGVVFSVMLY